MNILVLGPQGSGKGTQAKRIAATYGIPHIATGDMLREMKELPTDLGRELKEVMDRGDLVNDELMIRLIRDRLSRGDTLGGFVLDGFPRTMPQAEALDELLRELDRELDVVFDFQVPDHEVLMQRMLRRAAEEGRSDDTPEAMSGASSCTTARRAPLIDYYRTHQANVVGVHADRSVDEVFEEIQRALDGRARVAAGRDHPQVRSRDRGDGAARARSSSRRSRSSVSTSSRASTMRELDRIADEHLAANGATPTSKGYKGFPAALCISPNSMVVHGIPNDYAAREGDLISLDLGVTLDGLVADSAVTLPVGEISPEAQRLLDVCQEALAAGIDQARPGNHLSDISHAVQVVVEDAGFSVVRSLVGHGVGRSYHEDPQIPNYGPPGRGPVLQEGMTLAIEPMITAGEPDVYVHDDDWSISSVDESLAAHFEHTVAVLDSGPRILTTAKAPLLR